MEPDELRNQVWQDLFDQYIKMREEKGYTLASDLASNTDRELLRGGLTIIDDDLENWEVVDRLRWLRKKNPEWSQEWLRKTLEKSYKDRLKVGISLLIAELERVMYLENQRISNNDSSTASSSGDPESNG